MSNTPKAKSKKKKKYILKKDSVASKEILNVKG